MLYVRIEIWPKGERPKARCAGEMVIHNISDRDDDETGDYVVYRTHGEFEKPDEVYPRSESPVYRRLIFNFPRKELKAWNLVKRALEDMF